MDIVVWHFSQSQRDRATRLNIMGNKQSKHHQAIALIHLKQIIWFIIDEANICVIKILSWVIGYKARYKAIYKL